MRRMRLVCKHRLVCGDSTDAVGISAAFTVVSLLRSYALRRLFNWWAVR